MAERVLTDSELLDLDSAILITTLPVVLLGFAVLIVAGWYNDRKDRRRARG